MLHALPEFLCGDYLTNRRASHDTFSSTAATYFIERVSYCSSRVPTLGNCVRYLKLRTARSGKRQEVGLPKTTVLIVDDDHDVLESIAALLSMEGHTVIRAHNVRDALDLLDEHSEVDIVLSDVRMPEVDGFAFARVLRARFPSLPVALITGLPITDEDAVPRNVVVLKKPVEIGAINDLINELAHR